MQAAFMAVGEFGLAFGSCLTTCGSLEFQGRVLAANVKAISLINLIKSSCFLLLHGLQLIFFCLPLNQWCLIEKRVLYPPNLNV